MNPAPAWQAAEAAARESYGRLLAYLAYRWRDIAAAEDALAEAFAAALAAWPRDGVPAAPDAWLMTAAKRNLLQAARHAKVEADPAITILIGNEEAMSEDASTIPDERLKLLFVCAHPAIDPSVRTALMLQTVLGLEARQIAAAFLVTPAALAQRLVRAKAKIRDAGLRFEEPDESELPERVHAVLEAIYAAYSLGWDGAFEEQSPDLAHEALYLAHLVTKLLPAQAPASAEATGLLALLLFCESRHAARTAGGFVPLHEQDSTQWDRHMIRHADDLLWQAAARKSPGRFQLEAAIQSAHCQRAFHADARGSVPWAGIAALYAQLAALAPTVGALVGQAVAVGEAQSPAHGLALLEAMDDAAIASYQPWWVAKGYLLAKQGERVAAREYYVRAIGLTELPAVRDYLLQQVQTLN